MPKAKKKAKKKHKMDWEKRDKYSKVFGLSLAVIIVALAAEVAGSLNPDLIAAEINGVTKDGEACTSFEECATLIEAGTDIDYNGISGALEFSDAGEPTTASILILEFDETGTIAVVGSVIGNI